MTFDPEKFHLAEFEALRREIEMNLNDEQLRERHSVLAIVAVWIWLATAENLPGKFSWAWWIPCGIVIVGIIRIALAWKRYRQFHVYLMRIEDKFNTTGWEHFRSEPGRRSRIELGYYLAVWGTLLVASVVVPVLVWKYGLPPLTFSKK